MDLSVSQSVATSVTTTTDKFILSAEVKDMRLGMFHMQSTVGMCHEIDRYTDTAFTRPTRNGKNKMYYLLQDQTTKYHFKEGKTGYY